MPHPMKNLLAKIVGMYAAKPLGEGIQLNPQNFSDALQDFAFSGEAEHGDMTRFLHLAMTACDWVGLPSPSPGRLARKMTARKLALIDLLLFLQDHVPNATVTSPHFPHLNLYRVIYQLAIRVVRPMRINQLGYGMCGPAHFLLLVAKTNPQLYIRVAVDLLVNGKCVLQNYTIEPNKYIRSHKPELSISEADWLLAASVRNADREVPAEQGRGEYGGTNGSDVFRYLVGCGYRQVVLCGVYHSPADWLLGSMPVLDQYSQACHGNPPEEFADRSDRHEPLVNIQLARDLCAGGWRVLLLVNGSWANFVTASQARTLATKDLDEAKIDLEMRAKRAELEKDPFFMQLDEATQRQFLQSYAPKQQVLVQTSSGRSNTTGANLKTVTETELTQEIEQGTRSYLSGAVVLPAVTHWVLAKAISIHDGFIQVTRYTWGAKEKTLPLQLEVFCKAYLGFVASRG